MTGSKEVRMHGAYWNWWRFGAGAWLPIGVIAALAVAAVVAWRVTRPRRTRTATAGLTDQQRETAGDFEMQVTALLAQRGGEADQTAIVAALGLPADLVAGKLLELERAGAIERRWSVDRMTYSIRKPAA